MAQPLVIAPRTPHADVTRDARRGIACPAGTTLRADSHLPMPQWPRRAALTLQWELRVLLDGLRQQDSGRSYTRRAAVSLTRIVLWLFFIALCALLAACATIIVPPLVVWRCARDLWGSA